MTLTTRQPGRSEVATPETRKMKVLAIGSQKGGSAKSTTSLYLATRFAEYLGGTEDNPVVGLLDRDSTSKNLTGMIKVRRSLLRPGVKLLEGEELPKDDQNLRLVVIDTPPGLAAIDSLQSADLLVVPVIPSEQGVVNLVQYLRSIKGQRVSVSPHMRLLALLPANVKKDSALHREMLSIIRDLAAGYDPPLPVLTPVPSRTRIERWDLASDGYDEAARELFNYARL